MSGCRDSHQTHPASGCHGYATPAAEGSGPEVIHMEASPVPSESALLSTEEETQRWDGSWSQDGDLRGCGQLERRWLLWRDFMAEHAHLDAWLLLAEQAVSSRGPSHIAYVTAKEDLRKFERLRCEAGPRLVQLDGLTRRNRTLTRLFRGAVQTRLLAAARQCGQRWDDVSAKLESITGRLKLFVSEWEGFEAEREELALWLADLDVRLTEVDHLKGNTHEKLRQMQSFQQCVCVISGRVNALLQRGEALMERSGAADARRLETRLLELLRRCSLVYNNIARTHTRLLSMRLVFEDDWILSQATDSGCPSETLLEEEGALDKAYLGLPAFPPPPTDFSQSSYPPSPPSPTHEHLGLEWDPSVDIGRSVSCDDADSSYFSAGAGGCHRDGVKRRSYLSCQSDISNEESDLRLDGWLDPAPPRGASPVAAQRDQWDQRDQQGPRDQRDQQGLLDQWDQWDQQGPRDQQGLLDQWATSTPASRDGEPVGFDGGRVRAWLGVLSPAPPGRRTSCSKGVQTDAEAEAEEEEEDEDERLLSEQSGTSSRRVPSPLLSPGVLCLLLAAALALLACLTWAVLDPPCHRSARMPHSFHLTLRYVNGPPPT